MVNSPNFMKQPIAFPYSNMGSTWGASTSPYMLKNPYVNNTDVLNTNVESLMGISPQGSSGMFSGMLDLGTDFSSAVAGADGIADYGAAVGPTSVMGSIGNWFKDSGFIGTKDAPGWGGMALGAAGGLASAFLGMKQYGLAKKTLEENKRQFGMNYDAQKTTTNTALEDRQRARVASNAGAYQSVGDYMNTNGIK